MNKYLGHVMSAAIGIAVAFSGGAASADNDSKTSATSLGGLRCLFSPNSAGCPPPTGSTATAPAATAAPGKYTVIAWNDLGMHCVDGKDYSVMSILPPYNNLHAQVINTATGKQVTSGFTLTYEALADPSGSINTTSSNKTNFWQYAQSLYGAAPAANRGLNLDNPKVSNPTPGKTPAAMSFNATQNWFEAVGIPITPYDDAFTKNYYPMVKVVAKDSKGTVLGSTQTVLPVSDEMTCKSCHASNASADAKPPLRGWVNFTSDPEKDWKKNILRLHDDKHANDPVFQAALAKLGPAGSALGGLASRAENGTPTLCASCHGSNALNSPGFTVTAGTQQVKISALTSAMHKRHSSAVDPASKLALDAVGNRNSCYQCHPGAVTKCLRGAMSETPNLDCQSCHGNMAAVGNPSRTGWLQQPNCQSCHHDGKRETTAVTDVTTGAVRAVTDSRFATTPNKPAQGYSLFRFSTGHGKLQCEACHGSTHAEYSAAGNTWSSTHDNDILEAQKLQGYAGTITECTVCHASIPTTANGGPHGMHTIGQSWVGSHGDSAEKSATACAYCHGADYRGTSLSMVKTARTFKGENNKSYTFPAGSKVGCYTCHNGPKP